MKKSLKILSVVVLLGLVSCNNTSNSSTSTSTLSPTSAVASSSTPTPISSTTPSDQKTTIKSEFKAGDLANATSLTDYKINSVFSIVGAGVTYDSGSGKTVKDISGNDISSNGRLKNLKQTGGKLQITVTGDKARLLVYIAASGSSNRTLTILSSTGSEVYSKDTSSSEIFTIDITLEKGTYTLGGSNGYNLYYGGLTQQVSLGNETGFNVDTSNVQTNLFIGETLDLSKLSVTATYDSGAILELTNKDYSVDITNVNTSLAGDYNVIVKYKSYLAKTITINVSTVTDIEIKDFIISGKNGIRLPKVYKLNDTITTSAITVIASSSKVSKVVEPTSINLPKTDTVGKKQIEIKYGTITKYIDITVIDSSLIPSQEVSSLKIYNFNVNSSYIEGTIGNSLNSKTNATNMMNFSSIQNALDFIKTAGLEADSIKNIEIDGGTYHEKVYVETPKVVFNCDSNSQAIIEYDALADTKDGQGNSFSTYGSSSVTITSEATNFVANNVIFKNTAFNTMDEYNLSKYGNKQACALVCDSDGEFNNCTFIGFQDTLYARLGNQKYTQCKISGMTDYIFGEDSNVYFKDCEITSLYKGSDTNNGYIAVTKPSKEVIGTNFGYVFDGCDIKGEYDENNTLITPVGTISLARPWGKDSKISYVNCTMDSAISKKSYGDTTDNKNPRFDQMSGNLPNDASFAEYNNSGEGAITSKVIGGTILTEIEYNDLMEKVHAIFPNVE